MNKKPVTRKGFRTFKNHREADNADIAYFAGLSGAKRLQMALELMQPFYAAYPRFERILRVAKLKKSPVRDRWGLGV